MIEAKDCDLVVSLFEDFLELMRPIDPSTESHLKFHNPVYLPNSRGITTKLVKQSQTMCVKASKLWSGRWAFVIDRGL